eukprot:487458_1
MSKIMRWNFVQRGRLRNNGLAEHSRQFRKLFFNEMKNMRAAQLVSHSDGGSGSGDLVVNFQTALMDVDECQLWRVYRWKCELPVPCRRCVSLKHNRKADSVSRVWVTEESIMEYCRFELTNIVDSKSVKIRDTVEYNLRGNYQQTCDALLDISGEVKADTDDDIEMEKNCECTRDVTASVAVWPRFLMVALDIDRSPTDSDLALCVDNDIYYRAIFTATHKSSGSGHWDCDTSMDGGENWFKYDAITSPRLVKIRGKPTLSRRTKVIIYEKVGDTDFSVNEEQSRPIYASTESASTGDMKESAVLNVNATVKPDSEMKPSVKPGVKSKKRDQLLPENPGPSRRSKRRRTTVDREMFVAH